MIKLIIKRYLEGLYLTLEPIKNPDKRFAYRGFVCQLRIKRIISEWGK